MAKVEAELKQKVNKSEYEIHKHFVENVLVKEVENTTTRIAHLLGEDESEGLVASINSNGKKQKINLSLMVD